MNKEQKRKAYEEELLKVIKTYKYMRFSHIDFSLCSFSRATAYNYQLDALESIREALADNRRKAVNYLLQKWITSDNPTLQIAAMRLIADDEERKLLNQQYIEQQVNMNKHILPIDLTIKDKKDNENEGVK